MNYNICIPIPIKSANISEIKPILDKTVENNPNLIELRFDYINNIQNLSLDFLKNLKSIITSNIPVIFTFRDFAEGGQIKIPQKERYKILKMFIKVKPDYIDIEMNTDQNFLYEFLNLATQNGVIIIFSYHNFEKTISYNEAIKLITNFNKKINQEFLKKQKNYLNNVYKVVLTAQTFDDNIIPLKLCKHFLNSNQKFISFCMGPLGIFSRIMCVTVGSFLTYASLEEKTALGQIDIEKMREIYDLIINDL